MNTATAGASRTRLLAFGLLVLALLGVTLSLAHWQWRRAGEKEALHRAALQQRALAPLLPGAGIPDALPRYRRLQLRGQWLGEPLFLDNQIMHGRAGYQIIMAFLAEGETRPVLVRRGWMLKRFDQPPQWQASWPSGVAQLEVAAWPVPGDLLQRGAVIQGLDRASLQRLYGRSLHPLLLLETTGPPDGLQREWPAPASEEISKHLSYMGQWLLFSLMLCGVYIFYVCRYWRRTPQS